MIYHVMSANPGMHRGGHANPLHKAYETGDHTIAELRDLVACPHHTVVIGGFLLTETKMAEMQAEADVKAEAALVEMRAAHAAKTKKA